MMPSTPRSRSAAIRSGSFTVQTCTWSPSACAVRTKRAPVAVTPEAARKLIDYDWPGNVRELENSLERAVAVCNGNEITVRDLPAKIQQYECIRLELPTAVSAEMVSLDEMQRRYVRFVLNTVGGNKTHAARILGMDRRSVYRWIEPQ